MASTAGTCHWVSTAPNGISGTTDEAISSRPRCLSRQNSALPAPLDRAVQMGFHAPGLDPHLSKCFCQQAAHAWPKPTSLQIRIKVNLYNTHSGPNWSYSLTRFNLSLRLPVFSAYSLSAEQVSLLMPMELCCSQSTHAQCSACFPLPPWRGGEENYQKKKKVGRNDCALRPFAPWRFNVSVKEHTIFLGLVPMLMEKKKMAGGKKATHASYICHAASPRLRPCLLLPPGGALFADRDGLRTAVNALVGFLRSILCFALITF